MQSKVLTYPAIETLELPPEQRVVARGNLDEEIEAELDFIRRKHAQVQERQPGETLEPGDSLTINAVCSAEDAPAKFNKEGIGLALGKGFYDKAVEEALLAHAVGDTFDVAAGKEGQWPVTVTVTGASHTVHPPLTDADFQEEGRLNGVETANEAEYIAFLKDVITGAENLNHFLDNILPTLATELVEQSTFDIDPEELKAAMDKWYEEVEDLPDYLDEDSEDIGFVEYVQEMTGSQSTDRQELTQALFDYYEEGFKYNLILLDLAKGVEAPSREEYRALMDDLSGQGFSEEDLAEMDDYDQYVFDYLLEVGQGRLIEILEKQFQN